MRKRLMIGMTLAALCLPLVALCAPVETGKRYTATYGDGTAGTITLSDIPTVPDVPPVDPTNPEDPPTDPTDPPVVVEPGERPALAKPNSQVPDLTQFVTNWTVDSGMWSEGRIWALGRPPAKGESWANIYGNALHICQNCAKGVDFQYGLNYGKLMTYNASFRFHTLVLMPGSVTELEADTPSTLLCNDELVSKEFDPSRRTKGIINLDGSSLMIQGRQRTMEMRLTNWAMKGDDKLYLPSRPENWSVGDIVRIPGTRHAKDEWRSDPTIPLETETRTIAALDDDVLTLDRPLEFDHKGALDRHGNQVPDAMPYVLMMTQDVQLASESFEFGRRGHILDRGMSMVRGFEMRDLGDTMIDKDSIIGNYGGLHYHMNMHFGNVCEYSTAWFTVPTRTKTTFSIHATCRATIRHCNIECSGTGVWGETGDELDNIVEDCTFFRSFPVAIRTTPGDNQTSAMDRDGVIGGGIWDRSNAGILKRRNRYLCVPFAETSFPIHQKVKIPKSTEGSRMGEMVEVWMDKRPSLPSEDHEFASGEQFTLDWNAGGRYPKNGVVDESMPELLIRNVNAWHVSMFDAFYYGFSGRRLENIRILGDPSVKNTAAIGIGGSGCPHGSAQGIEIHGYRYAVNFRPSEIGSRFEIDDLTTSCPVGVLYGTIASGAPFYGDVKSVFRNWTYVKPTVVVPKNTYSNHQQQYLIVFDSKGGTAHSFWLPYSLEFQDVFGLSGFYYPQRQHPDFLLASTQIPGRIDTDAAGNPVLKTDAAGNPVGAAVGKQYQVRENGILVTRTNWLLDLKGVSNQKAWDVYQIAVAGKVAPCLTKVPLVDGYLCQE